MQVNLSGAFVNKLCIKCKDPIKGENELTPTGFIREICPICVEKFIKRQAEPKLYSDEDGDYYICRTCDGQVGEDDVTIINGHSYCEECSVICDICHNAFEREDTSVCDGCDRYMCTSCTDDAGWVDTEENGDLTGESRYLCGTCLENE